MRALPALMLFGFVSACGTPQPDITDTENALRERVAAEEVIARMDAYGEVLQAKDVERYVSYWAPDARFLGPGADVTGSDVIRTTSEAWDAGMEVPLFDWEALEVFVHGDVAYVISQHEETIQMPGEEPVTAQSYGFARWEKQSDGEWAITRALITPMEASEGG